MKRWKLNGLKFFDSDHINRFFYDFALPSPKEAITPNPLILTGINPRAGIKELQKCSPLSASELK